VRKGRHPQGAEPHRLVGDERQSSDDVVRLFYDDFIVAAPACGREPPFLVKYRFHAIRRPLWESGHYRIKHRNRNAGLA
jgi:hypothetical protein